MLNRGDIAALKSMQARVQELERRLTEMPSTNKDFPMGRLAEACRAVDDAILQVLITAKVYDLGASDADLRLTPKKSAA